MDSRDIKTPVPEVYNGQYLEKIYDLQKELLKGYIGIEGLPQYPIDVNPKKSQVLIKDFVGRVIEELAECYESLEEIQKLTEKNKLWRYNYDSTDYQQCINHLQNASEEAADAMHFMVELLIYINVQPEDIHKYMGKYIPNMENTQNIISLCMKYGKKALFYCNDLDYFPSINLIEFQENLDPCLYQLGKMYNKNQYLDYKKCLWDVTSTLNLARNCLKNKPWKQSQMMTDEIGFQAKVVEAFIFMMGTFNFMGLDSETLFYIYFKKNEINKFRQASKY